MILKKLILLLVVILNLHSSETSNLETITISATKLTDSQMNTSSSVDVIDEKQLEDFFINNIEDISNAVSNVNISGIGNRTDKTFNFRGISNYVAYESSVAMYIDDVPVPMSYGYGTVNMNDVVFLEILKGPQSTLFGKNAESGVINIYTKKPSTKLKSEFDVDISQYNSKNLYGYVSGPTSNDKLLYSLSITNNTTDGYTKNIQTNSHFDKKELNSFSSKLQYNINDENDLKLNYTKSIIDDGGSPYKINTQNDPFTITDEPQNDSVKMDNDLLSLVYTNTSENYKFTSVSTYAKQSLDKEDYVGILNGLIINQDIHIEEISQEFRLNYHQDNYDFLGGLFFSKKLKFDYNENQELQAYNLKSTNSFSNLDENKAIFLQGRYWINTNYALTLGARYQQIKREFLRDLTLFNSTNLNGDDKTVWNHFTPMASLNYFSNSGDNVYFTYTQGYRPGGYNYRQETTALTPYKEETTSSYELGYKKEGYFFDVESAIFYNDIEDLRINTFTDNLATVIYNADKAYSYGIEGKISYKEDKLKVYSTASYTVAEIEQLNSNPNLESKNLMDIPQITASLGAKYNYFKNYFINGSANHIGKIYYNKENTEHLNGYTITNLSLGYEKKAMNLSLYANNLFDKEYSDFMIDTPSNNYYHFGKPRTIGLKFSKSF